MSEYPFDFIREKEEGPVPSEKRDLLRERPFVRFDSSFEAEAPLFCPGETLETAINTAIAVGEPLLITGEPGTGKTMTPYYVGWKLDAPVFHFQAKSDVVAGDLLYEFDTVRYFHDAHLGQLRAGEELADAQVELPAKSNYVEKRSLWEAFAAGEANESPAVLLIDEIDKAPRDFPNDLLHEINKMEFVIKETGEKITCPREFRPLTFITSNTERALPEPFLRRCVYHHIEFTEDLLRTAVESHRKRYPDLSKDFKDLAIGCFMNIRARNLRKLPATGEFLVWLQILSHALPTEPERLKKPLDQLPYLGKLIKHAEDYEELR